MINRSVDLADGLLYHYFPGGKKEIFKEVITGNMQEMFQELQEPEKAGCIRKNCRWMRHWMQPISIL